MAGAESCSNADYEFIIGDESIKFLDSANDEFLRGAKIEDSTERVGVLQTVVKFYMMSIIQDSDIWTSKMKDAVLTKFYSLDWNVGTQEDS